MEIQNKLKRNLFDFVNTYKAVFIMLVMVAIVSCTTDRFFTTSNLLNILRQVAIYVILSTGYTLIISAGCIDLSVGHMLSLLGIIMAKLMKEAGVPVLLSFAIGILSGMIFASINASISLKFNLAPFIVTLGMQQVYRGLAQIACNGVALARLPSMAVFVGQGMVLGIPFSVVIMLAVILLGNLILRSTALGRQILAVGGNADAAYVSGISVKKVKLFAYALMGAGVGVAAIVMNGRVASAQPTAGTGLEMDAVAAVIIGGTRMGGGYGNVLGSLFGCLLVGVINNALNLLNVSAWWQWVAKGLLIITAVVLDSVTESIRAKSLVRK